MPLYSAEIA